MPNNRTLSVLDAPSNLGLTPPAPGIAPGAYKLAGALRDQRLLDRLGAGDAGVLTPPGYSPELEHDLVTLNQDAVLHYSLQLAGRIDRMLDAGKFPVVLGGDCSIILGPAIALRRRGRYGLVYVDGHADFRHPGNADNLTAASGEDLATVTGRGTDPLSNVNGLRPYIQDEDVAVLGIRDVGGWREDIAEAGIFHIAASEVRGKGSEAAHAALSRLDRPEIEGFWLHVDADVLDGKIMPAVDDPHPDGINWDDLTDMLRPLLASQNVVGMQITIYDPDLDPDASLAARLTDAIVDAFTTSPIMEQAAMSSRTNGRPL